MKIKLSLFINIFILATLITYGQENGYSSPPKIYAVIIGISDYKDAEIPDLKYPEKDAVAFYDFLRTSKAGAVAEEDIALLIGPKATRNNILREVVDKFTRANKEDLIIFYFSGHGKSGEFENTGYFLNYDSENDNEAGSALAMDEIKGKIDKCKAKMKISYIDACHAGLFKTSGKGTKEEDNAIIAATYLEGLSKADKGNITFLASSEKQQSLEDDKLGHGIFTYFLLRGLNGEADMEQKGAEGFNNGIVATGEMSTYLTNKIQAFTKFKQRPTIDVSNDEFFPLSILKPGISISAEIAKRQIKKNATVVKKKSDNEQKENVNSLNTGANLSGTWVGSLTQANQTREFSIVLEIKTIGNEITGKLKISYAKSPQIYAQFSIEGNFNDNQIVFSDNIVIAEGGYRTWCLKKLTGKVSQNGNELVLSGNWDNSSYKTYAKKTIGITGTQCGQGIFECKKLN